MDIKSGDAGPHYGVAKSDAPKRASSVLRVQLYILQFLGDLMAITAAFVIVAASNDKHFQWAVALSITLATYAVSVVNTPAFDSTSLTRRRTGIGYALRAVFSAFGLLILSSYLLKLDRDLPRLLVLEAMGLAVVGVPLVRELIGKIAVDRLASALKTEIVVVDGVSIQIPAHYYCIDAQAMNITPDLTNPLMLDQFAKLIAGVDRVVIACPPERRSRWAMLLKGANVEGEVLVPDLDLVGAIGIRHLSSHMTLAVSVGPLGTRDRIVKRLFDLGFCVPALIALAPVLLITAIAIKLDSRGPIFFKQRRVGRGNEFFQIFKFRSMRVEQCDADGKVSTSRDDDRITRVGKIIRRTSIDELPQLLNVLFGSMSLVGPRPHALGSLAGDALFWEIDQRYWHRHTLKPGITGLAQVRGYRGATHHRDDLTRRLQADLEYVANWSVWRDLSVLLSTFKVIVHRNTY